MEAAVAKRPLVVKIGGSTLGSGDTTLEDLVALQRRGVPVVVVHGGGQVISRWMERTGAMPRFVRGLRVTDEPTMEVVLAVLGGLVNKRLVAGLQSLGGKAVGLSGVDGGILQAQVKDPEMGLVGEITQVNRQPLLQVMEMDHIPVVAPVALGRAGDGPGSAPALNVNGDTATGALAAALEAQRLVFLTDVEGVMDSGRRLMPRLLPEQARALIGRGVASGGMIPKLEACLHALPHVEYASIIDGRVPHALLDCMDGVHAGTRVG